MIKIIYVLGVLVLLLLSSCQYSTRDVSVDDYFKDFESAFSNLMSEDNNTNENIASESEEETISNGEIIPTVPVKTIQEGELVEIRKDIAFDPDGDALIYAYSEPFDSSGKWQTKIGDAGEYFVTIKVSDGKLSSSINAKIIVEAVNSPPIISNFNNKSYREGDLINLRPTIADPDDDPLVIVYSGFMNSSTHQTDFGDAGVHEVTLSVSDGHFTVEETIQIIIDKVNRPPVISGLENIRVVEGESVVLNFHVSDPDGDTLSVSIGKPFNDDGIWNTKKGDAGNYEIQVKASDGVDEVVETVRVLVDRFNRPPSIEVESVIEVNEGDLISLNPKITDPDGDPLVIVYSGFMNSSTHQTDFGDAGTHFTTINVTDGFENVEKEVEIIINKVNRSPVFETDNIFK